MRSFKSLASTCALAGAFIVAAPIAAQAILISDLLIITDDSAHILPESIVITEADEIANGAQFVYKSTIFNNAPNDWPGPTLVKTTAGATGYSDIFGIYFDGNAYFVSVMSAGNNAPLVNGVDFNLNDWSTNGFPIATYAEDQQGVINATMYLDPILQAGGYTATFVSVSDVSPVPEPSTLALFGAGLLGISVMRRRRMAKV
jgi:hypothetical protein